MFTFGFDGSNVAASTKDSTFQWLKIKGFLVWLVYSLCRDALRSRSIFWIYCCLLVTSCQLHRFFLLSIYCIVYCLHVLVFRGCRAPTQYIWQDIVTGSKRQCHKVDSSSSIGQRTNAFQWKLFGLGAVPCGSGVWGPVTHKRERE